MDKIKDENTIIFDGEYDSLLESLKKKYNDRLQKTADKHNAEYRTLVIEALGEEFRGLVHERVLLLKNLKIFTERLVKEGGIASNSDKINALNKWISENDRDQKRGEQLIFDLINEASTSNFELVNKIKHISKSLKENREQVDKLFNSKGESLKKHEDEIKSEMKKVVLKLMLEYNLELKILRKQFDLPPVGLENPFSEHPQGKADKKDLMEQLSKDDAPTFFDVKDNKDDLN